MADNPENNPEKKGDDEDLDLFSRLATTAPPPRVRPAKPAPEEDLIDEFWATFALITPTGERYTLSICFRNKAHYNSQMQRFETAKNLHIVLKDINDESVVIKRDLLLHVLPAEVDEAQPDKQW